MQKFKLISIIIPIYNEEKTVKKVLEKLIKIKFPLKKEIICIDDGSIDNSADIINNFINKNKEEKIYYFYKRNQGKGSAVRLGLKKSKGDILAIQDADLEYEPEDLKKMIQLILKGNAKAVYGSRYLSEKGHLKENDTITFRIHKIGNNLLSFLTTILYLQNITDMETCYKMFTREVYKKIHLYLNDFGIEAEITAKIRKLGYRIKEVPINYFSRDFREGKKITWKDGLKALFYLIKFRFFDK